MVLGEAFTCGSSLVRIEINITIPSDSLADLQLRTIRLNSLFEKSIHFNGIDNIEKR